MPAYVMEMLFWTAVASVAVIMYLVVKGGKDSVAAKREINLDAAKEPDSVREASREMAWKVLLGTWAVMATLFAYQHYQHRMPLSLGEFYQPVEFIFDNTSSLRPLSHVSLGIDWDSEVQEQIFNLDYSDPPVRMTGSRVRCEVNDRTLEVRCSTPWSRGYWKGKIDSVHLKPDR